MAMSNDQRDVKILFIYEKDGQTWSDYLKEMFDKHYDVNTTMVLSSNLEEWMMTEFLVKVIILSPGMEYNIEPLLIANSSSSGRFNIFYCNVNIKRLLLQFNFKISNTVELKSTPENVRELLLCIIEDYEYFASDQPIDDEVEYLHMNGRLICIDVVPEILYPGQSMIFIIFNIPVEERIHVKVNEIEEPILAQKVTANIFSAEMPENLSGRKTLCIHREGCREAIFTVMLTVVTPDLMMDNFLENLYLHTEKDTLRENANTISKYSFLNSKMKLGTKFNPFGNVDNTTLENFLENVTKILGPSIHERKSTPTSNSKKMAFSKKQHQSLPETDAPTENVYVNTPKFYVRSNTIAATVQDNRRSSGTPRNSTGSITDLDKLNSETENKKLINKLKGFFIKDKPQKKRNTRKSQRVRKAQMQTCDDIPNVPDKML